MNLNGADIKLGGADKPRFVPNINSSRWNDEAFLNLNYAKMDAKGSSLTKLGGLAEIEKGNEKFQIWQLGEEVLETAVVFASRPKVNEIRLRLLHGGNMRFEQQPALTPEQVKEGHVRPDNVTGSYAVYIDKANHKIGGQNYQAGKFAHLYRWYVFDAKGKKAWCKPLALDNGDLVITLPGAFLDKADYPVTAMGAGDTFGYTTVGGSSTSFSSSWKAYGNIDDTSTYIASTGDQITAYSVYGKKITNNSTLGVTVYSGVTDATLDGGLRAFAADTINFNSATPNWQSVTGLSHTLTNALRYAMCFGDFSVGAATVIYYDTSTGSDSKHTAYTLDATWSEYGTGSEILSMYVTYTAGGAVSVVPFRRRIEGY